MIEAQRRAYLEALDIPVWLSKAGNDDSVESDAVRLSLEGGSGSILLLCRDPGEPSSPIARDIGRLLGDDAVWGWPDPSPEAAGPSVAEAVDQQLFTRIVIFGASLAERLFGETLPSVIGSAGVDVSADLDELALSGDCRKSLWRLVRNLLPTAR